MSDFDRQSPRAAICKWLQVTDSKLIAKPTKASQEQQKLERASRHQSKRHHATRSALDNEDQYEQKASRKHQRHSKSEVRQKRIADKASLANSLQAPPQKHSKDNEFVSPHAPRLAERLGLHAPFRTFKDHSDDDDLKDQGRARKRRRSRSRSSYLEPATANDFSDNRHDRPSRSSILPTVSMRPAFRRGGKSRSPTTSQASEILSQSPRKHPKCYERRPRHKTRPDRYELKENDRNSKMVKLAPKKDSRERKKQKKQKRPEKSGAALMHDYAAQNVAHDRLTLKPAVPLGLFGKGRASSPVRRKGLPDLAFSEMTFLTSRREKSKDSSEGLSRKLMDKKKPRKSTKVADAEAEISRYFMSAKPTSVDVTTVHRQQDQQPSRWSRDHESQQAPIDLPERPFLGFGSCGPNASTSPAKSLGDRNSKSLRRGASRSFTRSTSYLTWSQSRAPSHASSPPGRNHHVEPLKSSKLSNRQRTSSASHKDRQPISLVSPSGVQRISSGIQEATFRPASKDGNANEAPGQNIEPQLAIGKQVRSREQSQKCSDTETIEPNAANIAFDIKGSTAENTTPAEAAAHDGADLVLQPPNQTAYQSAAQKPQCGPPAYEVRPISAPMPTNPPYKGQLDDVLEALLRDCNTNAVDSNPLSRATSTDYNLHADREMRAPAGRQEHSRMPASTSVNREYTTEALASASKFSRKPHSASAQYAPTLDDSRSTHTPSIGNPNSSNGPSFNNIEGHPVISAQNQVDSKNAWNGYDTFYQPQQEQTDAMPETLTRRLAPDEAAQDNQLGMLEDTDHGTRSSDRVPGHHFAEVPDDFDGDAPKHYQSSQVANENNNYQEVRHGERYDQEADQRAFYDSGASMLDVTYDGIDDENKATNHTDGQQQRERPFSQGPDKPDSDHCLFTTNLPEIYSSWQPRQLSISDYGLKVYAANARVQDVDSNLSKFWTPHKLY